MAKREDVSYEFATEPALPAEALVRRWTGREALSTLYSYEVEVTTGDAAVGLCDFIGARAQLVIRSHDHTRTISGVIAKARVLSGVAPAGGGSAMQTAFHFGPELAALQHRHGHRIFQDMTTEEIVTKVIKDAGIYMGRDVTWRHEQDLVKRTYCVQYRESDFAFISRLLEDEGLFFYFTHGKDGDALVISDGKDVDDIAGEAVVPCLESYGLAPAGQITGFVLETEVASNKFSHRDYDYEHPLLALEGLAEIDGEAPADGATLETYEYPGNFVEPDAGKARAENFLGALVRNAAVGRGEGAVTRLLPGLAFSLSQHPRSELNGRYILRSVEHRGTAASFDPAAGEEQVNYRCSFSCTPEALVVRPLRSTPKPRMYGAQTAMVVGPSGTEVYVDDQSRIKVQFHWDREGKADEASSCWVRVAQTWSGAGWGALTVPRVGMEVVVHFLEGDPDKPLVTGCVYNATHPPPLESDTKSVFRTNSSPGGGGANELSFEDKKGAEQIYLHAQRDLVKVIERNVVTVIGGTRKTVVKGGSIGGGESSATGHLGGELSSASTNLQSWSQQMVANTLTEAEEARLQELDKNLADFDRDKAAGDKCMDDSARAKMQAERDALQCKKDEAGPPALPDGPSPSAGGPRTGAGGAPPTGGLPTPSDTTAPRKDLLAAQADFEKKEDEFRKNLPKVESGPQSDPVGEAAAKRAEAGKGPYNADTQTCEPFGEQLISPQGVLVDGSGTKVSVLCADSFISMVPGKIDIGTGGTVSITAPNIVLTAGSIKVKGGATEISGGSFLATCGTNTLEGSNLLTGGSTTSNVPTLIDNTLMVTGTTDIGSKTSVFADLKCDAVADVTTQLNVPKVKGALELNC